MPHAHFDAQVPPNIGRKSAPLDRHIQAFCLGLPTSVSLVEYGSSVSFPKSLEPSENQEISDGSHIVLEEVSAALEANGSEVSVGAFRTALGSVTELPANPSGALDILFGMIYRPQPSGDHSNLIHGGLITVPWRKTREIAIQTETQEHRD